MFTKVKLMYKYVFLSKVKYRIKIVWLNYICLSKNTLINVKLEIDTLYSWISFEGDWENQSCIRDFSKPFCRITVKVNRPVRVRRWGNYNCTIATRTTATRTMVMRTTTRSLRTAARARTSSLRWRVVQAKFVFWKPVGISDFRSARMPRLRATRLLELSTTSYMS